MSLRIMNFSLLVLVGLNVYLLATFVMLEAKDKEIDVGKENVDEWKR